MKITRNKKKSKLPQLVKRLLALNGQKTSVGYFQDSGIHTLANMSYASLAFIHAFPRNGYHHTRNWLDFTKPMKGSGADKQVFKTILNSYIKLDSRIEVADVLEHIGSVWQQKAKQVLGNSALLYVSNNPTPLVDTGELRDHMGFRTSINYTLRRA